MAGTGGSAIAAASSSLTEVAQHNREEYERRIDEADADLAAALSAARREYRRALDDADSARSAAERAHLRDRARAEYRQQKREHREEHQNECDDADDLLLQAQVIDFPDVGPVEVGGASGVLAATASSGLGVTYSVVTPDSCEIVGSEIVGLAAADCTVTASQPGDGVTWAPAPDVSVTVTVTEFMPA